MVKVEETIFIKQGVGKHIKLITVNGWYAGGKGGGVGVGERGGWVGVQSMGEMGAEFCRTFSNRFLKTWTEGAVTTRAGSLFQYFTTLTTPRLVGRDFTLITEF